MSELFDEIARSLARPMPRRRLLSVVGVALLTASVPALRPRTARAGTAARGFARDAPCSFTGGQFCGFPVNNGFNIGCCWKKGEKFVCCNHNKKVGSWCCRDGYTCGPGDYSLGRPNCMCAGRDCGGKCCAKNQECENGECVNCTSERRCGKGCCKPGEFCASKPQGLCCKDGDNACAVLPRAGSGGRAGRVRCCPPKTTCCANDQRTACCGPDQNCRSGKCTCPKGTPCGSECCTGGKVCTDGICCPKGQTNCNGTCCPSGRCCGNVCCNTGEGCASSVNYAAPRVCCKTDRIVVLPGGQPVCCPKGTAPNESESGCCPPGNPNCCGSDENGLDCLGRFAVCVKGVCVNATPTGH